MDAIVEAPCDVAIFRQNSLLWVHCLDIDTKFELSVRSFPILKLKCLYGHVCFPSDLSERRLVVFPDSDVVRAKFAAVKSPCCIEVKSSAVFEVDPKETDDQETKIAVIWDFDLAAGMTAVVFAVKPVEKDGDGLVIMPRLDFKSVSCNCTKFPLIGDVLCSTTDAESVADQLDHLELCGESEEEEEEEEEEDVEEEGEQQQQDEDPESETTGPKNTKLSDELFTEVMVLKGSSYHALFQANLRHCKQRMMAKESMSIRLLFEPANIRDENAIVVQVKLAEWLPIGYIAGTKVPKVTKQ